MTAAPAPSAAAVVDAVRLALRRKSGPVALHEPEFRGREREYLAECIDTGWVSSAGKFVDRFEAMLAEYTGAKYAVATVNGSAALQVCLRLAGVGQGDEVLVPSLTFIATANAVSYALGTPHFVESEEATLGVDAAKLEAYLKESAELCREGCVNRRTGATIRALMPMHTFGHPVDLDGLAALCARWRIALVEDAAESLGSTYKGRHTGNFGLAAGLSFNGNKIVTSGGGGAILSNDAKIGARAKHLTTTARVPHKWSFIHDEVGYNYRLPNLNAALGCAQLERLPDLLARKRALASRYQDAFKGVAGVRFAAEPANCRSNYWLNTILLDAPDSAAREAVLEALNREGFGARPAWTLMHRLPMYQHCPRMDLAFTEDLERRIVNLPSSAALADAA